MTPPPVQGVLATSTSHPVITTMCASGVLALVDRKVTPQAQGTKVRVQGAKVRTEGAKVGTSIHASQ